MSETLKYIFSVPEFIEGVGEIHPIKLMDYDEFAKCANILSMSKQHFPKEAQEYPLLDLIVYGFDDHVISTFEKLFSLVLKKEVFFASNEKSYAFISSEVEFINNQNYEQVRQVIMKQNLLFEEKVWKNPRLKEFAEKWLEARSRNSIKMTIEDMVTTVAMFGGIDYEEIANFTIYQLKASFDRIDRLKSYDTTVAFKCAGADKVNLNHFAEQINMFEDPYKDLFKSEDKLNKLNSVFGK